MKIRKADLDDSHDIWLWRNDFQSRAMFKDTSEVPWERHQIWFAKVFVDPNRFLYIGVDPDQQKIGICRFDLLEDGTAEVSINLNPLMRGRGLSSPLLSAAIDRFWMEKRVPLRADVKNQNRASIRCFENCGFILKSRDREYDHFELEPR